MTGKATATVETLTAEVRVLMVGSRQVTLSVWNQLDWSNSMEKFETFGRVCPNLPISPRPAKCMVYLVGRNRETDSLERAKCEIRREDYDEVREGLPLIVLAGLR